VEVSEEAGDVEGLAEMVETVLEDQASTEG